jgi:hypothetical protein
MTAESVRRLRDDAVNIVHAYCRGIKVRELAAQYRVNSKSVHKLLGEAGVLLRRGQTLAGQKARADSVKIVKAYTNGKSILELATRYRVARDVVQRLLVDAQIPLRTQSEQEQIKWSQMTVAQRKNQVAAAHKAKIGRKESMQTRKMRAKTFEKMGKRNSSPYEPELQRMLEARGLKTFPQRAVGPYNCDLAVDSVAVEIRAAYWEKIDTPRFRKRVRYFLHAGWHVLLVMISNSGCRYLPLSPGIADQAAAFIEEVRRDRSAIRKYRVIWGKPDVTTSGSADDKKLALKYPLTNRRNLTTGRYESVPRQS